MEGCSHVHQERYPNSQLCGPWVIICRVSSIVSRFWLLYPEHMFEAVMERIQAACDRVGRKTSEVKLVAVSKNHSPAEIEEAILKHGHRVLGENRIQEWQQKARALEHIEWHFIGNLQRNKVKYCLPFELIHSVNSLRLIDELQKVAEKNKHRFKILIEVNVAGEESKQGLPLKELDQVLAYAQAQANIELKGLMTMAPYSDHPEDSRPYFEKLHNIHDRLMLDELSMGMSGDFEVAIEEGATIIRVGSALFRA